MDRDELLDELDALSEHELGTEWMRAYNDIQMDLMAYYDFCTEEREFIMQRASYLVEKGNSILRSL